MEHEIKGHAVKAYKVWKNPNVGFWHKFTEIAIEVGIIVFAVMLSIWLHSISEHSHQQKEVKTFLLGLKKDLQNDIAEMQEDKKSYINQGNAFTYFTSIAKREGLIKDSLMKHYQYIFWTTGLIQNNGRYEGFKSSGKIGNIEDVELQNDITDLYQENIVGLLLNTDGYTSYKKLLFQYLFKNLKKNGDGKSNFSTVILSDEAQNICSMLNNTTDVIHRYNVVIDKSKKIVAQIDKMYQ